MTGLHTHLAREEPRVWFLHLAGSTRRCLATAVGAVLQTLEDVKGQPREAPPPLDMTTTLNSAAVDSVLRMRGRQVRNGYEITIPRSTRLQGYDLGESSGISTRDLRWE